MTAGAGRPPRGELADRLREVDDLVRRVTEQIEQVSRPDERDARLDEERADAARSGTLGPHWLRIQQRVDRGEVTLAAVFTGEDGSPEAEQLRSMAARTLRDARSTAEDDPAGPAAELLAAVRAAHDRLGHVAGEAR